MRLAVTALAAALPACTSGPTPTQLAGLGHSTVYVQTSANQSRLLDQGFEIPAVVVTVTTPRGTVADAADCPSLAAGVHATYDGAPLVVTEPGGTEGRDPGIGCKDIQLELAGASATPGQTSTLVLADGHTTWTIEGTDLLTNDFTMARPSPHVAVLAWPSAEELSGAFVRLASPSNQTLFTSYDDASAVTYSGDSVRVEFPPANIGPGIVSIQAVRAPVATRCEGPADCELTLWADRDFTTSLP